VPGAPKVLAPVAGRPFLHWLLQRLERASFSRAILSVGDRANEVVAALGTSFGGISLSYVHEQKPLGTGGGLRNALAATGAEELLVTNGDSLLEAPLQVFWHAPLAAGTRANVALASVPDGSRFGRVRTDAHGRITGFLEKGEGGPGFVNGGVYRFQRGLLEEIPEGVEVSLERELMPRWAQARLLTGWPGGGALLDIGTPQSFAAAADFLADAEKQNP
jgi:D-glycero-alpha-D-manno-heptose 1-phosphate guanylyltransferase